MRNFQLLILLFCMPLLLGGCFEKREVEDLAYVIAIGIDKGSDKGGDKESDNSISISFQIAVPIKIAGEGSEAGKESTSLITLEADSIYNAISRVDTMVSKEITLSHNKIIVFSEEVAKEGITDYLNSFVTNREIRPKTSVIVHKGSAKDFLANLEPVLESNPARYYDLLLNSSEYSGYAINNSLFQFYLASRDNFSSPYAILTETVENENISSSGNTQDKSSENPNVKTSSHESTPQENTGELKQQSGSSGNQGEEASKQQKEVPQTANVAGIAIFKSGKMVGEIRDEQIISQLILQNHLTKVNIDIEDIKEDHKTSVVKLIQQEKPKITVKIQENKPQIDILINLDCQLLTSGSAVDYNRKENRKKLEEKIEKKLKNDMLAYLHTISKEYKADPVGFGKYCKINVPTLNELSEIKWSEIFPDSTFQIHFQLHLNTIQMVSNEQEN